MATDKLFTVAGVSTLDGQVKVRFATDIMRIKVLAKSGHEDINLVELDTPMTKLEAVQFIKGLDEFAGVAAQAAIADYLDRNEPKPAKAPKTAKAPAAKAPAKAKTAKVTVPADAEDAPF